MFGEHILYDEAEHKMDSKRRIVIPKWTGVEPTDNLIVMRQSILNGKAVRLVISKQEEFDLMINKLCQEKKEVTTLQELEEINARIDEICQDKITCGNTDAQRRIMIPVTLMDDGFDETTTLVMKGSGDRLFVYPSKETFKTATGRKLVK